MSIVDEDIVFSIYTRTLQNDVKAAVKLGVMPENAVTGELLEELYPGVKHAGLPVLFEPYAQKAVTQALLSAAQETPWIPGEPWHETEATNQKVEELFKQIRFEKHFRGSASWTLDTISELVSNIQLTSRLPFAGVPQARASAYAAIMLYPHLPQVQQKLGIDELDFECDEYSYELAYFGTPEAVRVFLPDFLKDY